MYMNLTVQFSTEISIRDPQNEKRSDLNKIKYSFALYDNFQDLIADFKLFLNVNKVSTVIPPRYFKSDQLSKSNQKLIMAKLYPI